VAFGLKDTFTLIQNAGLGKITQVRASGTETEFCEDVMIGYHTKINDLPPSSA
jgi:hypothetical protein